MKALAAADGENSCNDRNSSDFAVVGFQAALISVVVIRCVAVFGWWQVPSLARSCVLAFFLFLSNTE